MYGQSHRLSDGSCLTTRFDSDVATPSKVNESFTNGYTYVIIQPNRFTSPVGAGRPPFDRNDMITSLCKAWQIAQFLLAMQANCFIACNGWSTDFAKPLGPRRARPWLPPA